MKNILIAAVLGALLTGCVAMPPSQPVSVPFDKADFEPFAKKGTGKIRGQAFLTTVGGEVKYAAGKEVSLIPATAYSKEVFRMKYNNIMPITDSGWIETFRQTIADGSGSFEFESIPAGEYYVETSVTWGVPTQYGISYQGHAVRELVKLEKGENKRVILNKK